MPSWLSGWQYRKSHTINGSSAGAVTDYQVRIRVHYGEGSDSGEDVYLNNLKYNVESGNWTVDGNTYNYRLKITVKENSGSNLTDYQVKIVIDTAWLVSKGYATSSGNEVRFTQSDGSTLLSFWRENSFNQSETVYWVKIPSLSANSEIYIYMYFDPDLTSASDVSDGYSVFDFFEDFETDKSWVNIGGGSGTYTVSDSIITMTETGAGTGVDYVLKLTDIFTVNGDGSQEVRAKVYISVAKELHLIGFTTDVNDDTHHYKFYGSQDWGLSMEQPATASGQWQVIYAILDDFSGSVPITIGEDDDSTSSAEQKFDWILIRKYVSPEPVATPEHGTGKCRTDFGDIRFTSSDGATLLDYWIEELVEGDYAVFWVEVDSIPASPNSTTIYIYYGKSDATTTSSIVNTFLFGDEDFSSGWSLRYGSVDSWGISDGVLWVKGIGSDAWIAKDWSGGVGDNIRFIVRYRWDGDQPGYLGNCKFGYEGDNVHPPSLAGAYDAYPKDWKIFASDDATQWETISHDEITKGVWYRVYWTRSGNTFKLWVNDNYKGSKALTVTPKTPPINVGIETFRHYASFDYIAIGKYVDPEPSHGAWGSEETPAVAWEKTLTETLGLSDAFVKAPSSVRSEALGLIDLFSKTPSLFLAEPMGLNDYTAKSVSVSKRDQISLTDVYGRTWVLARTVSDVVALSDAVAKRSSLAKHETVSLSDAYSRTWQATRVYGELISLSDTLRKHIAKISSDTVVLTDSLSRGILSILLDSISLLDSSYHESVIAKSEALALLDTASRIWISYKVLLDSIALSDVTVKSTFKPLFEVVSLSDMYARTWLSHKTLSDVLALSDYAYTFTHVSLSEPLALSDQLTVVKRLHQILSDLLSLSDSLARSTLKPVSDAVSLSDSVARGVSKPLHEPISLVDALSKAPSLVKLEPASLVDTLLRAQSKTLTDLVALSDTLARIWDVYRVFTEKTALADSALKHPSTVKPETIGLADTFSRTQAYHKRLDEALGLIDTYTRSSLKQILDRLAVSAVAIRDISRSIHEPVALADTLSKTASLVRLEPLALADTLLRTQSIMLSDLIALSDAIARRTGRTLREPLALSDTYSRTWVAHKTLSDLVALLDTAYRSTSKTILEPLALLDSLVKSPSSVLMEAIALRDEVSRVIPIIRLFVESLGLSDYASVSVSLHPLSERIALSDTEFTSTGKSITETLGLLDSMVKEASKTAVDRLGLADAVSKSTAFSLTDLVELVDRLSREPSIPLSEAVALSDLSETVKRMYKTATEILALRDTFTRLFTVYRTLPEKLGLTDTVSKSVTLHPLTEIVELIDSAIYAPNVTTLANLIRKYLQLVSLRGR